nr:hypothetical protein [Tanacetum cinerariifolium]
MIIVVMEMITLTCGIKNPAGSESRPPILNKENYVPWSSRLLCYAKSRPNEKLIHNSILNGPYVRRMIPEPSDAERDVNVDETFHEQTDDELSERELKQIEADDQAIQTILLGLPEDIYAAVDRESIDSYYHRFLVASRGWSFTFVVPGLMTQLVTSLTPDSANSCVMQGASCTQRKVSMVLFILPSVLLLVVIVVPVVIVMVILVVVVVAIVGVVVGVVSSSVSSINKLLLVIIGSFSCYWSSTCLGVPISIVSICHVSSLCFQSSSNAISNQLPNGSLIDLTGDEDPFDEDRGTGIGDSTGVLVSLGEISLEGNKSWESNICDSDNTGDGGKIAGEKTSMSKRYLVKLFEESGETFPGEAEK